MKFHVEWNSDAEADLAQIWTEASDRRAVAEASDKLDESFRREPTTLGESRGGNVRIAFCSPLAVEFEVVEADAKVLVVAVWTI